MAFVSDLDKFLQQLDKRFPQKSESQQKVIQKYARLNALRDAKPTKRKNIPSSFIEH